MEACCAIALVFITGVYTYYASRQACLLRKSIEDAQKAQILDERAWVAVYELIPKANEVKKGFAYLGADVHYRNSGKTPAIKGASYINQAQSLDAIPDQDTKPVAGKSPTFLLAPNGVNTTSLWLDDASVGALNATEHGAFIYGTIWYTDIFQKDHWSQFCAEVSRDKREGMRFNACPKHQKSDEEK